MADDLDEAEGLSRALDGVQTRANNLVISANGFSSAMSRAFQQAAIGGKQFDEVLKQLALRLSNMVVTAAFRPITSSIAGALNGLFGNLSNAQQDALGAIKPFAAGGVIGTPTYFPMLPGGVGLAGEAGPEAILPLSRGPDGRLGVSGSGAPVNVHINIATPDLDSFRRSESYLTGQIARAVARGQRSL